MGKATGATRTAYDRIAAAYAGPSPGEDDPEWRRQCRMLFASRLRGTAVLEVGCGPGVDADRLSQLGLAVTATDFCDEFVRITKERFPHLDVRRMDMTDAAGLIGGTFDGVYGHSCFLHVPRALAAGTLRNLASLLKPGGVLFLSLIESAKVTDYTVCDWGGVAANPVAFHCYRRDELKDLLASAGFIAIEVHQIAWSADSSYHRPDVRIRLEEHGVSSYQIVGRKQPG